MIMRKVSRSGLAVVLTATLGVGLAAAAQDDSKFIGRTDAQARVCFRGTDVDGFAAMKFENGQDGVNLRVKRDVYQMKFVGACPEIRESTKIAIESIQGPFICSGADADIIAVSRVTGPQRCRVSGMRKVEAAELASLPAKEKP
jgi:hypothetical protein